MPRVFGFPFRFGSPPAAASSATTAAETPPSRWATLGATTHAWNAAPPTARRFEAVKWAFGRQGWNGGVLGGQLNFVVDVESGFRIASDGNAVIASESTLNG